MTNHPLTADAPAARAGGPRIVAPVRIGDDRAPRPGPDEQIEPVLADEVTRRRFLALVAVAGLVAGCGGATVGDGSSDDTEEGRTPRGEEQAARVIALGEEFLLADLLGLGIRPVASTATVAEQGFSGLDEFDTEGIEALPATEPNLERLAVLRPDVIVFSTFVIDELGGRDALDAMAELVVIDEDEPAERLLALGDAFGARHRAETLLGELDEAVGSATLQLDADGREISVATVYPGRTVAAWVDGPSEVPSTLLALGFTLQPGPEDIADAEGGRAYLSPEQLGLLAADTLVALQSSVVEGEDAALADIAEDPLWSRLPGVADDRVVTLDRLGYPGIAGRRRLVDDLARLLA